MKHEAAGLLIACVSCICKSYFSSEDLFKLTSAEKPNTMDPIRAFGGILEDRYLCIGSIGVHYC